MSGSRQSGNLNMLLAALLFLAGTGLGRAAFADPAGQPMQLLSRGARPYVDTVQRMISRDRQMRTRGIIKPQPKLEATPRGVLPRNKRFGYGEDLAFPAPPFRSAPPLRGVPHFRGAPLNLWGNYAAPMALRSLRPAPVAPFSLRRPLPTPAAPQVLGTGFDGISLQDQFDAFGTGSTPPDTMGAVGPNHFVENINTSFAIFSKTGTRISHVRLNTFFTVTEGGTTYPRNGAFDPRIVFDRRSGRWFATAMERGEPVQTNNHIILAVSRTSDPTGVWDKYVLFVGVPNEGTTTFFTDYSTLGVDDNGVYFGMTIFPSSGNARAKIAATPKASLLAASPSLGPVFQTDNITDLFSSPQPAHNLDAVGAGDRAWFVSSSVTVFGNVNYRTLTWSGGTPTLSATSVVTTPGYALPFNAPASGSTEPINNDDDRLLMATIRNNRLWTTRNISVNNIGGSSNADRDACEWLELDVAPATPTLAQSGRVYDPNANPRHYYYPAIMVSGQGHVAMGYSGSRSDEFVGAYTSGRLATDPLGTMQAVTLMRAGDAAYTLRFSLADNRNRWGDYSYTSLDPNDDMTMWTIQEYARPTGDPVGARAETGRWGTWIQRLLAPPPTLTGGSGSGRPGQSNISLALTGTNFYDPGASFPSRLAVAFSDAGVSTSGVTYNGPTSATALVSIAGNAAAGARNIVLTNPDGQSTTLNNAFTVNPFALTSISPSTATPGGGAFTLTVTGNTFVNGDTVLWNGAERPTTFVSASQITAAIPASDIAASGSAVVTVRNPNGAASTNAQVFIIGAPQLRTVVTSSSRANGVITMNLTISNTGTATAASPQLTSATLGSANASTLPALGDIAAGASVNVSLAFPDTAGPSGTVSVLRVRGTYTGGTFSSAQRVALP